MKAHLANLRGLVPHLAQHGADEKAREWAQEILRYFDDAVPRHHADEEQTLFPALLESMAGSDPVCLRELTMGLAQQHRTLEMAWLRCLRPALERVAAGDEVVSLNASEVEAFADQQLRHIGVEDDELLPMAARLLSDEELDHIGAAIAIRRPGA
jgi:hemerythrin-like domain-containing protein